MKAAVENGVNPLDAAKLLKQANHPIEEMIGGGLLGANAGIPIGGIMGAVNQMN
jgi:ABC-type nitrate/sulfonate/bicarbonate transport system permease component